MTSETRPHVVIVGGGFGGLNAAKALRRAPVRVTLVDRANHHVFQPLLYQVATAALNPSDIAYPLRAVLRNQGNARVLLADVVGVDVVQKRVALDRGALDYDYLVLATGATHSYFGHDEWSAHAPGLKTINDAVAMRQRILFAYEAAERESDPDAQREWLTFVVVGAGPTGVELAGALAEIGHHTLAKDFRRIDPTRVRVLLLEGRDRVLPPYVPALSASAREQLERLGVEVRVETRVTGIDDKGVSIGSDRINARTVLWAAGVAASPVGRTLGAAVDAAGRVVVEPDLSIAGHPEVFVIGDLAAATENGEPIPGVAPAAIQMGKHTAGNIERRMRRAPTRPFHYKDQGSLATIGRASAVADFGHAKFTGFLAWLAWLFIHVVLLIGFRNRVLVLIDWAWSFVTFQRGARLITGEIEREKLPSIE